MASPKGVEPGSHDGEQQVVPVAELRSTISQMLKEVLKEHEDENNRDGDNRKGRVTKLVSRSTKSLRRPGLSLGGPPKIL